MGCSASTLDTEQSVTRCKNRKHFIKLAVRQRHAFAAAHAAYIQSLKNTGAAIRQFGEGEAKDIQVAEVPSNAPSLSYFPPPVPHFLASLPQGQPSPIARTTSMPALRAPAHKNMNLTQNSRLGRNPSPNLKVSPGLPPARSSSLSPHGPLQEGEEEEEEEEEEDDDDDDDEEGEDDREMARKDSYVVAEKPPPRPRPSVSPTPPPPPPPRAYLDVFPSPIDSEELSSKVDSHKIEEMPKLALVQDEAINQQAELQQPYEKPSTVSKNELPQSPQVPTKTKISGKDVSHILKELDDQFLLAFESGKKVANLLEARKMHYHSNFADVSDSLDHSQRVLRVMSWGRNPELPLINGEKVDLFHSKEKETHASTLDKLLAWEKKLHDEVKAGELIRIELERKSVQLKNQKKREENPVTINKTKAVVKSLQTRYLVEIQAVDAAASEVDKLRDECLHNQLVDLVNDLKAMWNSMLKYHEQQYQLIKNMESLDGLHAPLATNDSHLDSTLQLESEMNLWHQNLDKLLSTQKEYINAVYHWLRLHIIQIESDGKDTPGSPQKMSTPPVYNLCRAWLSALDQLPGSVTLLALKAFSSLIHDLTLQQMEELKQKRKVESLRKELEKKEQNLRVQEAKYNERRHAQLSMESKEDTVQEDWNPMKEREKMVQFLRDTVERERGVYELMCSKSGSMALSSLEKGLPPLLSAIKDFASMCLQCYTELHTLALLAADGTQTLQISNG